MWHLLRLHPDSSCEGIERIAVEADRPDARTLVLRYAVTGALSKLSLPPVEVAMRRDDLWRHTCFEAFVRASPGPAYYEFNIAPTTQWAAYAFSSYREGMRVAHDVDAPVIEVHADDTSFELRATLGLDRLADLPGDETWSLGLSAVIEASGRKSYWALTHPPGKADFHHSDCFVIELPRARPS